MLVYTGARLGANFRISDDTGRRLLEQIDEHRRKNKKSHTYQHSVNSNHALLTHDDFTILNLGYKHNKFKRKISEALFIKSNKPNFYKYDISSVETF